MDILQHLATIDDIKNELEKVKEEEQSLSRQILFNLTGNQDYYDPQACTDVVKSSAIEYNRIASDLRTMGSSVKGNSFCRDYRRDSIDLRRNGYM